MMGKPMGIERFEDIEAWQLAHEANSQGQRKRGNPEP